MDTLKTIATTTTTANRYPFAHAYRNLMQQLSVSLWKFNSRLIQSRMFLVSDNEPMSCGISRGLSVVDSL